MHARASDSSLATCPICHAPRTLLNGETLSGLYVCQHCQERLVVSWSGHYVRDPFALRYLSLGKMLRRQSSPFARILRDIGLTQSSRWLIAGSLAALGITLAAVGGLKPEWLPNPAEPDPLAAPNANEVMR